MNVIVAFTNSCVEANNNLKLENIIKLLLNFEG